MKVLSFAKCDLGSTRGGAFGAMARFWVVDFVGRTSGRLGRRDLTCEDLLNRPDLCREAACAGAESASPAPVFLFFATIEGG